MKHLIKVVKDDLNTGNVIDLQELKDYIDTNACDDEGNIIPYKVSNLEICKAINQRFFDGATETCKMDTPENIAKSIENAKLFLFNDDELRSAQDLEKQLYEKPWDPELLYKAYLCTMINFENPSIELENLQSKYKNVLTNFVEHGGDLTIVQAALKKQCAILRNTNDEKYKDLYEEIRQIIPKKVSPLYFTIENKTLIEQGKILADSIKTPYIRDEINAISNEIVNEVRMFSDSENAYYQLKDMIIMSPFQLDSLKLYIDNLEKNYMADDMLDLYNNPKNLAQKYPNRTIKNIEDVQDNYRNPSLEALKVVADKSNISNFVEYNPNKEVNINK